MINFFTPSLLTNISRTNSVELILENSFENGWMMRWLIPAFSINMVRSAIVFSSWIPWSSGNKTIRGCGKKVSTTTCPFTSPAIFFSLSIITLCPRCTPSNVPRVITALLTFSNWSIWLYIFKNPIDKVQKYKRNKSVLKTKPSKRLDNYKIQMQLYYSKSG